MPADLSAIAHAWGCSTRTASRWAREGAPLGDSTRLKRWLASRKNLPAQTKAILTEQSRARRAQVVALEPEPDAPKVGAPAALRRLEQGEDETYRIYRSAISSGDPISIKLALENWLKVGDSLRRYDLLVESNRRDAGELVPRKEIEAHVSAFVHWFKIACRRTVNALAPNLLAMQSPAEVQLVLEHSFFEDILNALAALGNAPCKNKLPDWFLSAATRPMDNALIGANEATKARATALEDALGAMAEETARQIAEPVRQPDTVP
jgi:hypothetical protein